MSFACDQVAGWSLTVAFCPSTSLRWHQLVVAHSGSSPRSQRPAFSSAGGAKHTAAVPVPTVPPDNMPPDFEGSPPTPLADGAVDLSVKGVLISDFSNSEQLRYLERRSRSRSVSPFSSGQIQPDFCINI